MAENRENIEIRLVARADLPGVDQTNKGLKTVDASAAQVEQSLKKVEQQARRTAEAIRSVPRSSQAFSGLASPPSSSTFTSAEELRRLEREAGLRTERTMAAEDREAAIQKARTDAVRQSGRAFNFRTPIDDGGGGNANTGRDSDLSDRLNGAVGRLARTFIGYAAALRTVRAAIHSYVEDERAVASLDQALAQRSQLTDKYRESLQNLAGTLSQRTAVQSSTWVNALTTLTKFGADSSNIEQTAKAVEDLSGAIGVALPEAAMLVGKAMQGNFTQLARYGFHAEEAATQTEKLNALFSQFAERGAGQLEARAKTLSGEWSKMTNALGNLASSIGNASSETGVLQFWFQQVTRAATSLTNSIGGTIDRAKDLQNVVGETADGFENLDESATSAADSVGKVTKAADEAADALEREKKAMADQSSQAVKMIEAQSKLEEAKIKASRLSPEQKKLALASLEVQTQNRIYNAQQRGDTTQIHLDQQAGLDMNAELLRRSNELEDKKADMNQARDAAQIISEATRKTDYAEQLKKQLGFADSLSEGNQAKMVRSKLSVGGAAVSDEEVATYITESKKQIEAAEAQAAEARKKAEGVTYGGNYQDLKRQVEDLQKTYTALEQKYQEQQRKLDEDMGARERSRTDRAQLFGVESQTRRVNITADLAEQARTQTAQAASPPNSNVNYQTLFQMWDRALADRDRAVIGGVQDVIDRQNERVRNIESQVRALATRR